MPCGTKRTNETFINLSNEIHNNTYSYNNVNYINNLTEVIITCHIHGNFRQLPKCHLRGHGCNKCSYVKSANKKILESKIQFLKEIKLVDNENRWDYSNVDKEFTGTNNIITIKCNGCGNNITRTPWSHLNNFSPCRRGCFIIKNKEFNLKDNDNIISNEIVNIIEIPEEWKPFPDNENYSISNKGYFKYNKNKKVSNGSLDKISGYMRTAINKKNYSIHYMVAKTFLPNPDNKETVNHKNKNRTDNRVENLEWSTYAEQNLHKNTNSTKHYGSHNNGKTILRINRETNEIIEKYETITMASKWIIENIYKIETTNKNIEKELKSISSSLSQKIKKNQNNFFGYDFIWKFEKEITIQETEIWKPIVNIEKEGYYISNLGKIRNPSGKIKETFSIAGGYYDYKIIQSGKHHKIHRLVALHFIENPYNKQYVNHKNGNKLDNKVENLEWVTNQENVIHGYENGLNKEGLSPIIQYDKEGKYIIKEFKSISDASRELNIDSSSISACCREITIQTHGFHFKYKQNINKEIRNKKINFTCGKKIYQYDNNNKLLMIFNTIKECSNFHKVSNQVIKNKINGLSSKNKELNNYIFKFD